MEVTYIFYFVIILFYWIALSISIRVDYNVTWLLAEDLRIAWISHFLFLGSLSDAMVFRLCECPWFSTKLLGHGWILCDLWRSSIVRLDSCLCMSARQRSFLSVVESITALLLEELQDLGRLDCLLALLKAILGCGLFWRFICYLDHIANDVGVFWIDQLSRNLTSCRCGWLLFLRLTHSWCQTTTALLDVSCMILVHPVDHDPMLRIRVTVTSTFLCYGNLINFVPLSLLNKCNSSF